MRVLVIGSGAREHALAHVLARHAQVTVAPGNPGTPQTTSARPEDCDADLYLIGPEVPLVDGLADRLRAQGKTVFGPGADGARLEASKAWMKQACGRAGVPTARYSSFTEVGPALEYLDDLGRDGGVMVVKTDGLAAGKGVFVTADREAAAEDVREKLSGSSFGAAGTTVVLEEGLIGEEVSILAVSDGKSFSVLPASQDHKRVGDGDTGPNTGGIGAYSPLPHIPSSELDRAVADCVAPMFEYLRSEGIDYRGVLYAGLMLTAQGPRIIEYNVRFGDPETQVVLPLLQGDVAAWLASAAAGDLDGDAPVSSDAAITVIMCSEGYPGPARTGDEITGLEDAAALEGVTVFHAGTSRDNDGVLRTSGGRVLAVTAVRPDLASARDRAYEAVSKISWPGVHYRRDIAARALGPTSLDNAACGREGAAGS